MNGKHPPDNFNPYHKWLGIPEKKCPPTFYELLGISLNEEDRAVIQSAAERQKTHIEQYLGTPYNKFANQLISQIDEAEITLLSPQLRREYDRQVDLFKKRRKKRQFDPTVISSQIPMRGNRTVGEESGLAREYAGIVSVLAIAFFGMAAASFWLPWSKLIPDNENITQPAANANAPVTPQTPSKTPEPETEKQADNLITNSIGMEFKLLPAGTFLMGTNADKNNAKPVHQVILTKPFEMGVHEVTQEQYETVMGTNPSKSRGSNKPVEMVSWDDAIEFCIKLSALPAEKAAGSVYRLPTEAEWEYACRAGTTTNFSFGNDASLMDDFGWYFKNSGKATHPVGEKKPNPWGLYDMHGNIYEWCQDFYGSYPDKVVTDPTGASSGTGRMVRGGSATNTAGYCGSAFRFNHPPPETRQARLGFRVVRSSVQQTAGN